MNESSEPSTSPMLHQTETGGADGHGDATQNNAPSRGDKHHDVLEADDDDSASLGSTPTITDVEVNDGDHNEEAEMLTAWSAVEDGANPLFNDSTTPRQVFQHLRHPYPSPPPGAIAA